MKIDEFLDKLKINDNILDNCYYYLKYCVYIYESNIGKNKTKKFVDKIKKKK